MTPDMYILDANRQPRLATTMQEWGDFWHSANRRVALDEVGNFWISTVFVGIDNPFFETMVFEGESSSDIYCERCATWEQAESMHQKAIDWVKGSKK